MTDRKKIRLAGARLRDALARACDGLVYISETDSPIEPVFVPGPHPPEIDRVIRTYFSKAERPLATGPPGELLTRLSSRKAWHGEREKAIADQFASLQKLITENLDDVTLIRMGRVRIDIYILGFDSEGNIAGVSTHAIET